MIWTILFSQLVTAPFIRSVYTLPKMVALGLVLAACAWIPGRRSTMPARPWHLFLAVFTLTTVTSQYWFMSLCGLYLSGAETLLLAVLCFFAYRAAQAGKVEDALEAGAAAAAVSVVLGAFMTTQAGRWVGTTGQAARFGTALALGAAMAMNGGRWARAVPLILLGIVMSGSRGAILAVVVTYAYLYRRLPWWVFAGFAAAVAVVLHRGGSWAQSDVMRVTQAKAGWAVFLQYPWFGCGPSTFLPAAIAANQFHTHILPLNVLATQGLVGAVAWTILAVDAWRAAGREVRAVYVAAAVCSMLNPLPESAYVIMAVLYGASQRGDVLEPRAWTRRAATLVLAGALLVMAYADRQAKIGDDKDTAHERDAIVFMKRAHRWNPFEFYYFIRVTPH